MEEYESGYLKMITVDDLPKILKEQNKRLRILCKEEPSPLAKFFNKNTKQGKRNKSRFELAVLNRIKSAGLTLPEEEYKFHPTRKWRFDFAWPGAKTALECEGGCWSRGRHTRGSGFIGDCQKYNQAQILGWRVLRYTPDMINEIVEDLQELL